MKRSILVAAGTAAGVTAVVSYHAVRPSGALTLAATSSPKTGAKGPGSGSHHHARHTTTSTSTTTSSSSTTAGSTASSGAGSSSVTRTAVGEAVGYQFGDLQVKVTEHHGHITDVSIKRFSIPDQQSVSIDEFAVPRLRAEVLSAQSAHIDGVSGASYTSQAYAQSVQSALDKLA